MSYKAMDLVFEQHIADPQAKFVLIAIASGLAIASLPLGTGLC